MVKYPKSIMAIDLSSCLNGLLLIALVNKMMSNTSKDKTVSRKINVVITLIL
jgi:hypothetical protein